MNERGLGAHLTSATAMLVGVGVWLATVAIAHRLDAAGIRGPAEVLLRNLTYRQRPVHPDRAGPR